MKKILLLFILATFFIHTISATYDIEIISINPGEMNLQLDRYDLSTIIETTSGLVYSGNYEIKVGFLHSSIEKEELEEGRRYGEKGFINEYILYILILLVILIILIIIILDEEEKEK